jgi:hypothetical protein
MATCKVKHFVSMRQVNPNKASKEKTTIICTHIIKTMHDSDGAVMMMPENLIVFDGARKLVGV